MVLEVLVAALATMAMFLTVWLTTTGRHIPVSAAKLAAILPAPTRPTR